MRALDFRAARGKFFHEIFIAAIEMINAIDRGFTFGHEACENQRDRGP
jgi:hypothetical protein